MLFINLESKSITYLPAAAQCIPVCTGIFSLFRGPGKIMTQSICLLGLTMILAPLAEPGDNPSVLVRNQVWKARIGQTQGWTGGDGSHSIDLGQGKSLWLFADSWVGEVEGGLDKGERKTMRMVNQAAGVLDTRTGQFRFLIPPNEGKGFWKPDDPEGKHWYWPGDAVKVGDQLFVFLFRLTIRPEGEPGFAFRQVGTDCVCIDLPKNPDELDAKTLTRYRRIGATLTKGPVVGAGVGIDGGYLYSFTQIEEPKPKPFTRPMGLARVEWDKFIKLGPNDPIAWSYQGKEGKWFSDPALGTAALEEGATEMSLRKVPGVPGWTLVYMQLGMGDRVVMRHADRLDGTWSKPRLIGRVPAEPDAGKNKIFSYAVKIHPEVPVEPGKDNPPGTVLLTWSSNCGDLGVHKRKPDLYYPRFTVVDLLGKGK